MFIADVKLLVHESVILVHLVKGVVLDYNPKNMKVGNSGPQNYIASELQLDYWTKRIPIHIILLCYVLDNKDTAFF